MYCPIRDTPCNSFARALRSEIGGVQEVRIWLSILKKMTKLTPITAALLAVFLHGTFLPAAANETAIVDAMESYLEFVDYGGATIFPEQIPKDDWNKFFVIDTRDKDQFIKEHIPGAVNIEWRRTIAERNRIPKDKPVLLYCNTGSLSAQAGFALRFAGYENVRILQGGIGEWKAKGGLKP
jgi:rhodanese-related sulfurtransferase